jgi:hypothetical protein
MSRGQHTAYAPSHHGTRQARSDRDRAAWTRGADPGLLAQAERLTPAELAGTDAPDKQSDTARPVVPCVAAWWRGTVGTCPP